MSGFKKILINLPSELLDQVEDVLSKEDKNRSELIREAVRLYLKDYKSKQIREKMKSGYEAMGMINLSIAEENLEDDNYALEMYEKKLVESE